MKGITKFFPLGMATFALAFMAFLAGCDTGGGGGGGTDGSTTLTTPRETPHTFTITSTDQDPFINGGHGFIALYSPTVTREQVLADTATFLKDKSAKTMQYAIAYHNGFDSSGGEGHNDDYYFYATTKLYSTKFSLISVDWVADGKNYVIYFAEYRSTAGLNGDPRPIDPNAVKLWKTKKAYTLSGAGPTTTNVEEDWEVVQ